MKNLNCFCTNQTEMILKLKIALVEFFSKMYKTIQIIYFIVDKDSGQKCLTFATTCRISLLPNFLSFENLNII